MRLLKKRTLSASLLALSLAFSSQAIAQGQTATSLLHATHEDYYPFLVLGGSYGDQDPTASGDMTFWMPVIQTTDGRQLVWSSASVRKYSGSAFTGTILTGYRVMPTNQTIWGVYGGIDRLESEAGNAFTQLTLGIEHWHNRFFFGVNGYVPTGTTTKGNDTANLTQAHVETTGTDSGDIGTMDYSPGYETALDGVDGSVGYTIWHNLTAYVGGYYFFHSGNTAVKGERLRVI